MKKYCVSLNVSEEIYAEDEDEALGIFWDDFNRSLAEGERANVEELEG